jgi:hypothetical protein
MSATPPATVLRGFHKTRFSVTDPAGASPLTDCRGLPSVASPVRGATVICAVERATEEKESGLTRDAADGFDGAKFFLEGLLRALYGYEQQQQRAG